MLSADVHLQFLAHRTAQRVLRQHALDGMLDDALGVLGHGLGERLLLEPTREPAVTIVGLGGSLGTGDLDLVSIDDDDKVARVHMGGVLRLVLALQNLSSLGGHTTENLILSVDDDPLALNLTGLCMIRLHCFPPIDCRFCRAAEASSPASAWQPR